MRYATTFGTLSLQAPFREQSHTLTARRAMMEGFRVDGAIDAWGEGRAPFEASTYRVPFWLNSTSESAFETAKGNLAALVGSRNKLYFNTLAGTSELYSFARLQNLTPRYIAGAAGKAAQFDMDFTLLNPFLYQDLDTDIDDYICGGDQVTVADANFGESSDWETNACESGRIFVSVDICSSGQEFTIASWPGQFRTNRVIVRVEALGANGAVNFKVSNDTLTQSLTYAGTLTTNGVFQANAAIGPNRVRTSTDSGSNWTNAWASTTLEDTQAVLMELAPGDNDFTITADGTPNFRVMFLAKPAFGL